MLLLFLAFVVVLSGVVAYAADNIARRVGRKHLRLFGLRPKTTALIVAVLAGMGISFASVLAFGLLNRQALRNIAQADTLRQDIRELSAQLEPLRETVRQTEAQLENVRAQAARLERARDAAVAEREAALRAKDEALLQAKTAQAERDEALLQADTAAASTLALQERVEDLAVRRDELERKAAMAEAAVVEAREQAKTELDAARLEAQAAQQQARAELERLEGRLRELRQARDTLQAQVTDAKQREQAARARADEADEQATTLRGRVQSLQAQVQQLAAQGSSLSAERDRLRAERDHAQREVRAEQARRDALVRDNDVLRTDLQKAQAERVRLSQDVQRATSELTATRSGDLAYEKGELVHTQVVASVHNLPEALSGAAAKAAARGARGKPVAALPGEELAQLRQAVRAMNWSATIVFRSATNSFQGYPVELTAEAFPNRPLYQKDQVIRSAQIRLGRPEQVREQLLNLVSDTLLDLQGKGVPPEFIPNGGLSASETQGLLSALSGQGTVVRVGLASRKEVRPASEVELYPVVLR